MAATQIVLLTLNVKLTFRVKRRCGKCNKTRGVLSRQFGMEMKISLDVRDVSYNTSTTTANVDDGGNIVETIQLFFKIRMS